MSSNISRGVFCLYEHVCCLRVVVVAASVVEEDIRDRVRVIKLAFITIFMNRVACVLREWFRMCRFHCAVNESGTDVCVTPVLITIFVVVSRVLKRKTNACSLRGAFNFSRDSYPISSTHEFKMTDHLISEQQCSGDWSNCWDFYSWYHTWQPKRSDFSDGKTMFTWPLIAFVSYTGRNWYPRWYYIWRAGRRRGDSTWNWRETCRKHNVNNAFIDRIPFWNCFPFSFRSM